MAEPDNALGLYLKDRRARLDPASFGLPLQRRRTPGLRREEVAGLAHVSATWYTWLEQGRGGAPSADVLDRLARAFQLTGDEREHLYLLAQQRLPRVAASDQSAVSPQLQGVLDAMGDTPAIIKTPEWTVLAWNRAASVVLGDYASRSPHDRNLLRTLFRPHGGDHLENWQAVARQVLGVVRRDLMRTGTRPETQALIDELSASSADFRAIWAEPDLPVSRSGAKRLRHAKAGTLGLEFTTFAVDAHPDLGLVVFTPASDADRQRINLLLRA